MAIPQTRDFGKIRKQLGEWFASQLPPDAKPEVLHIDVPQSSGFSSETLLLDAAWNENGARSERGLVIRSRPTGELIFPEYDLTVQWRAMKQVAAHSDVPVPPLYWYEESTDILGEPFYVMGKVDGRPASDNPPFYGSGFIAEASPAEQEKLYRSSIEVLARLHALDWKACGFDFLHRDAEPGKGFDQQLDYWTNYLAWAGASRPQPTLEAALQIFKTRRPANEASTGLNWGDARPSNILYKDFAPAAVLDWEMACLGPGEVDLGWFLFMDRYVAGNAGVESLPGFLDRRQTVELYESLAGREVVDIDFYEAYGAFRYGVIWLRLVQRMNATGDIPDEALVALELNNAATQTLSRLLELPAPSDAPPPGR